MEENVDFNKTYAAFRDSEEVFVLYNEFFNDIDNFMKYQNKNPDNIIGARRCARFRRRSRFRRQSPYARRRLF